MVIKGRPFENRVIDAWHAIQYYLPRAITVMGKRNIYIICDHFAGTAQREGLGGL